MNNIVVNPQTLTTVKNDCHFDDYRTKLVDRSLKMKNVSDFYDVPLCFHEEIDGEFFLFHACDWVPSIDGWRYKVVKFTMDDIDIETKMFKTNPFDGIFYTVIVDEYGKIINVGYSTPKCYESISPKPIKIVQ